MKTNPDLLDRTLALLTDLGPLRTRRMFGGIYIYCDELFVATLHGGRFYLKANASTAARFESRGLKPFSYERQGEVATLRYYEAPPEVWAGAAAMRPWAELARQAAREDAARPRRRKSP